MRTFSKKISAAAASAVLAAAACSGGMLPLGASAAAADAELLMSVLAGGSQIGISFRVAPADGASVADYQLLIDGAEQTLSTAGTYIMPENAKDIAKTHTVSVKKGSAVVVDELEVSVSSYLQSIQTKEGYEELAASMLNYGYAAQNYFDSASPADYGMNAAPDLSGVTISGSKFGGKAAFNADLEAKEMPFRYYGMNLSLLDQVRFSLYFETDGEAGAGYLTDGLFGGNPTEDYVEAAGEGYTRIAMTVPAAKLTETFALNIPPADPVDFSPVQYLAAAAAGDDAGLTAVCKAIYAYGEAVKNFEDPESGDPSGEKWQEESSYSGEATFYDYGPGKTYPTGLALYDDFIADNNLNIAALTDDEFAKYIGGYIEVQRGGKTVCALVGDIMSFDNNPNANAGDVDLNESAFTSIADKVEGRVDVTWNLIPLPTAAESPISYMVKDGSTIYWGAVQVRNTTYPVAKLEWSADGTGFQTLERDPGCPGYFRIEDGTQTDTVTFRITDIFGQVVVDENVKLPISGTEITEKKPAAGSVQFPK